MKHPKNKKTQHEKPTLAEIFSNLIDVPADISCGMTLEMRGRNELLLCGCSGILEYSDSRIRIIQGNNDVCLVGRRLTMSSYSNGRIGVCGEIDAIDFCGGDCIGEKGEKGEKEE